MGRKIMGVLHANEFQALHQVSSASASYRGSACIRQIIEKSTSLKDYMFSPGRYGNYYDGHRI